MATIQARIEGRVGEAASGDIGFTATHMQDAFDHGLRAVIMSMPKEAWKYFGKNAVDFLPLVGTPLLTDKIISVLRRDGTYYRPCAMIEADMAGPAADSRSIHYASAFTPVYYVESGSFSNPTLKVLPEDGSKAARLVSLAIPTVDITTDEIVPHFPDELEELPELYVVIWIKQREMGYLRRASQDELEAITNGYLAAFEGDLPVFAPPTEPSMPTLTLVSMTALPTLVLETAPIFTDLDLSGIGVPTAVLSYTSAGDEPDDTISVTTALPTYIGPTAFTYDQTTSISDALTNAKDMIDNSGIDGTTDVETLLAADLVDQASVGIQAANVELTRAQTAIRDEQGQLQEFSEELREALGKFTGGAAVYQAELAKEVATVQADVQAYTAKLRDNRNILDKEIAQFNTDVQNYAARVRAASQEWQLEEVGFKLAKWVSQVQSQTAEYTATAGAYISEYSTKNQSLIGEYNAKAGGVVREYQALVQERVSEFQAKLSRASARLQESSIRLQTMQSFDQKSLAALNEARMLQVEFDKKLGEYKAQFKTDPKVADRRRK